MLNGLLSNQLADMAGFGRQALLLTPKGGVLTDLRVLPRSEDTLLDVPIAGLANLHATFAKYLPPVYAGFEDLTTSVGQIGLYGPDSSRAVQAALGSSAPERDLGVAKIEFGDASVLIVRDRWLAGDSVEFIAPESALAGLASRLLETATARGGMAVGTRALDVAHVEWGVPRYGIDVDESNLPQETGLERRAISFDKGCYMGQEVVARIHFRGHVNRLLRGLVFTEALPTPGAVLSAGKKRVGAVTSAVHSPELGAIGLGYVRREVEPGATLVWADAAAEGEATVKELPFRTPSV